ncbi:MAG: 2,3-bisphosphoglycerate-independent phosphoglycerate mutase [Gammaproteobacteria bacterium CG_4_10_14_0_8_um_filter_38_16]|nr:MAG: 2,3-bisphosphoglycerate-independent phosphoglycerate mutase [Gammaproteobacteria bacterium CG_4_10_14_0_8_um_filter_38_16]PJA03369.1 MAG: 2,3-bisphosphoglycerate-independent phosphoglycerate mutase [Gammaproteobacteria bacterium CG_4_10_14_0_2_um_filter_38_22]PJB11495.1 MAG: 2,3-bisphosphoglycerate-independent phosphoglycerate mutase [Gammaproteobacteria bacterium CG_4_9_14_3_um_filter_38_9]
MIRKPFALIILDGWGYRKASAHNPTQTASTPTIDALFSHYPSILIEASGNAVGLPKGQMGNSEVGHLHIGAGRKVPQDLTRIHNEIQSGIFFENAALKNALQKAKKNNGAVHLIGLLSPGGVHSHTDHLCAMMEMIHHYDIKKNYLHAICDGRDTPPQSALPAIKQIEKIFQINGNGQIASLIGRYFAMDRDNRWDRTQKAYDLFTTGKSDFTATSAEAALTAAYARGETDEFILPTCILKNNQPICIQDNDTVIFMNFRADRARQLTHAFVDTDFSAFLRQKKITLTDYVTLTRYFDDPTISVAYPPLVLHNTLGKYLSDQGLTQLRLAETEKYAHVTYFLNGGVEAPNKNEYRELIPSPKIATYDTQPEMSAIAVTDAFVKAIENQQYDVIICNYANPDMIGHTGNEKAAEKTMLIIDSCLKRVLDALQKVNGEALITSDHGNIELMFDEKTGQPHTAHTTNLVPLIYVGRAAKTIATTGALDDIAPTMLYLMGLQKPAEMTGNTLFEITCERHNGTV